MNPLRANAARPCPSATRPSPGAFQPILVFDCLKASYKLRAMERGFLLAKVSGAPKSPFHSVTPNGSEMRVRNPRPAPDISGLISILSLPASAGLLPDSPDSFAHLF